MSYKSHFLHFLNCYAKKDIHGISQMLADDVTLRDWNISVHGRAEVEAATQQNFRDAESIEIDVLHVYESQDAVVGELKIVVDRTIELYIVDVIQFDSASKLNAIRSYKGRAS
jgi:ketosteroid isomerase-like protein